jgi:hypothetical protein
MPGGSEICRHLCRIGCRSGQRAHHNSYAVGIYSVGGDVSSSQMSQPPLDPIAGNGISDSAADDKADAWLIDVPHLKLHNMDDQRRTTCAESAPGRSPKVLRAAHSQ